MTQISRGSTGDLWARFRFSIVGPLLSSPPARGSLDTAICSLAERTWRHPVTERDVRVAAITIARWYHPALRQDNDPVGALRRALRKDCGKISLAPSLAERLIQQYHDYSHWSCQLHYDNLGALVKSDPTLGQLRFYSTVRRYMRTCGLVRMPRLPSRDRPSEARA
jgi:putative transposase